MYKDLIDQLRATESRSKRNLLDRAAAAIERLEAERAWISVEDRLPEPGARVLATDGAFVGEFYINKRGKWQRYNVNDSSLLMALDILWWMPLPEPPKEVQHGK